MLTLEELLMETDPDLPVVATVIIGFDDNGRLVLKHESIDYEAPSESFAQYAVIEKQAAYTMARKLNVALTQLPAFVCRKFSVQPFCRAVPSEARALFKEILDFYIYNGIRYQLKDIL